MSLFSLPLSISCGCHLPAARRRWSNIGASAGAVEEIARIVAQESATAGRGRLSCRAVFRLRPRGIEGLVPANRVDFLFDVARNERLEQAIEPGRGRTQLEP